MDNSSTGFAEQVRLGDVASIQNDERPAFRAAMERVDTQALYWRGAVLDVFDGQTWIPSRRNFSRRGYADESMTYEDVRNAPRIKQEIFLEGSNRGALFAIDQPLSIEGLDRVPDGDGTFHQRWNRSSGIRRYYTATSILSPLRRTSDPNFDKSSFLALPQRFIPRLRGLVEEMTSADQKASEKIVSIRQFLASSEFSYTLNGLPRTRDALERFIFTEKRGHCEFFASAMAVMLRTANVPTRLISGYRGGIYNGAGGYYVVQEQHAHVWVEAWDDETEAWIRLDPTPAASEELSALGYGTLEMILDLLDYQWATLFVSYSGETQNEMANSFSNGLAELFRHPLTFLASVLDGLSGFGSVLFYAASALGALAVGVTLFRFGRKLGFFHFAHRFANREPERGLLDRFSLVMRRHGYWRETSEGLEEFLARVDNTRLRDLARPFARRFQEFYYRDRPMDANAVKNLSFLLDRINLEKIQSEKGQSALP
jgi:hypothetical protein